MSDLINNFVIFLNGILNAFTQMFNTFKNLEIYQILIFVLIIGIFIYLIAKFININKN